ncbi:MAG: radical SAM family heme chaperone HemW [Anaerolineae bacterium]|nr:radical SAM family heme chaperone HemW [Anaerolineae bacterium]MCA9889995.1 radical SAM family heme chaperone HemW [Anaerolineae bacterium]MCA9891889.1 radical SAM family heme chaperone HemW [Anaerolineae bacterium]MCB9459860.1 radical SAM family heme chaperone HemW [Anaerolineaceae bacterium]
MNPIQPPIFEDEPVAFYIHVPFCRSICTYCAFNTYADMHNLYQPYIDALCMEVKILGESRPGTRLKTLYFGGGTPSLLTRQQFEQIFKAIYHHFDTTDLDEITLESNPNDLTEPYLRDLRTVGFNRISIGVQSANQGELDLYGRRHDFAEAIHSVEAARSAGFANINLDLIYGAPDQQLVTWDTTLRRVLELNPDHFSLYNLELKGGTDLTKRVEAGNLPSPDDDISADMYDLATELLGQHGYDQYEISNWSKPGRQSEHNLQYWRNLPYLGLGPGAHGFANAIRYTVVRLPQRYIDRLQSPAKRYEYPHTPATAKAVKVDYETDMSETIMMSMRMLHEGVNRQNFQSRFGVDIVDHFSDAIEKHVAYGLLAVDDQRIHLTQEGRFLSNAVIRDFV